MFVCNGSHRCSTMQPVWHHRSAVSQWRCWPFLVPTLLQCNRTAALSILLADGAAQQRSHHGQGSWFDKRWTWWTRWTLAPMAQVHPRITSISEPRIFEYHNLSDRKLGCYWKAASRCATSGVVSVEHWVFAVVARWKHDCIVSDALELGEDPRGNQCIQKLFAPIVACFG